MALFKLDEKKVKYVALIASLVFFAFAIFFFSPVKLPHKITLTVQRGLNTSNNNRPIWIQFFKDV